MKKSPVDVLVTEWAYRCKKGYPDINNEEDKKVLEKIMKEWKLEEQETSKEVPSLDQIKNLLDANKDNERLLVRIYRTLVASEGVGRLKDGLKKAGIVKDLLDGRNVHDEFINILQKGEKSEVDDLVDSFSKGPIPESGNIYSEHKTVSKDKLQKLASLTGATKSVTIGKGELLFPLTYTDLELSFKKAGDFLRNGKTVELKDIGGRLGVSRAAVQYVPFNKGIEQGFIGAMGSDLKQGTINGNVESVVENINNYLKKVYPESNQKVTKDNLDGLDIVLKQAAVENYIIQKNIDEFLLFNSKTGQFSLYSPSSTLVKAIKDQNVRLTTTTNPQLVSF